jgi:L-lysine 2,3-aminomutase
LPERAWLDLVTLAYADASRWAYGIPALSVLGAHTVLLRGVNDDPKVMMKLMHELLKARVRPYYIYMADQVAGGEHFRTMVQTGLEIMQALRG